ncbi:sn-glycerol-3-phosphate ABC transporter permease UgpA [Nitratireductor kimnyeongensis]|uniref:sn-glycerol-3-phosphate transport system permease protein UgpA n=1 Tax=Nitratireductor kimnyeongensis TaxID=430679 RepID=A0ABW0TEJ1_9HYPH|nr:sn-glycerol-3-phosphate ABC transporter permease UgpA [Nitratireductor kimnyeongensis]QZZ37530.1 sn-glycerol-3-phosphate ABC transporter permease UgpA [Nitratireductor kimnyeongensis]
MEKRVTFDNRLLPYLLLAPQLAVTIVFFFWPAGQALYQSLLLPDPFGLGARFVWFSNFEYLFNDRYYLQSFITTAVFTFFVTLVSMSVALLFAVMADQAVKGAGAYKTLLIWPYAVAPAVAGVMWLFMFQPSIGVIAFYMKAMGIDWNPVLNGGQAMTLVILAAAWKQISYNFLFFLAGLQAIPKSLIEAAAIDGAGKWHRFRTIIFPLLSPTTFFLLVVNIVYAFFETFGIIHTMTAGGPGQSTTILVYKVYSDGFVGQDLGSSAAQSVILMVVVGILTVIQFRFIERRVHY